MALVNCKECKKEISDTAKNCPGCGASAKNDYINEAKEASDSPTMWKGISALMGFVLGFMIVVIGCGANHVNFISPASVIGGSILGSLFAILGSLLGGNKSK